MFTFIFSRFTQYRLFSKKNFFAEIVLFLKNMVLLVKNSRFFGKEMAELDELLVVPTYDEDALRAFITNS